MIDLFTDQAQLKPIMPVKKINFGLLYIGLMIVVLGIVYYFREKNGITIFIPFNKFWSILLIFSGLSIIAARTFKMIVVGVFLTLFVVYLSVLTLVKPINYLQIVKEENTFILDNNLQYDVLLDNQATDINLKSSDNIKNIESLFESNYTNLKPEMVSDNGKKIIYKNNETWKGVGNYYKNLNLDFPINNDYNFTIIGSYNNINLSLNNLRMKNLVMNSRLSNITIDLKGIQSDMSLDINTTLSSLKIENIQDIGIELIINNMVSNLNIKDLVKETNDNKIIYKSNDFDNKSKKVKINLNTKVSLVEVK